MKFFTKTYYIAGNVMFLFRLIFSLHDYGYFSLMLLHEKQVYNVSYLLCSPLGAFKRYEIQQSSNKRNSSMKYSK